MKRKHLVKRALAGVLSAAMAFSMTPNVGLLSVPTFVKAAYSSPSDAGMKVFNAAGEEVDASTKAATYGDVLTVVIDPYDNAGAADSNKPAVDGENVALAIFTTDIEKPIYVFPSDAKANKDGDYVWECDTKDKKLAVSDPLQLKADWVTVTASGGSVTYANANTNGKHAGSSGSAEASATAIKLGKKTLTISGDPSIQKVYDGKPLTEDDIKLTGSIDGLEAVDQENAEKYLEISKAAKTTNGGNNIFSNGNKITNVGEYSLTITLGVKLNATGTKATSDLLSWYTAETERVIVAKISKATIDTSKITLVDESGNATKNLEVKYTGSNVAPSKTTVYEPGDNGVYTAISTKYGEPEFVFKKDGVEVDAVKEVGEYTVSMSLPGGGNYESANDIDLGTVTVVADPLSDSTVVALNDSNAVFGKTLTASLSSKKGGSTVGPSGYTFTWYADGEKISGPTADTNTLALTNKDWYGKKVTVKVSKADKSGEITATTKDVMAAGEVTIASPLAIIGNTNNKEYDGSDEVTVLYTIDSGVVTPDVKGTALNTSNGVFLGCTGKYADKNVGTGKTITFSSYNFCKFDENGELVNLPQYKLPENFDKPTSTSGDITKPDVSVADSNISLYYVDDTDDNITVDDIRNTDNIAKIQIIGEPVITGVAENEIAKYTITGVTGGTFTNGKLTGATVTYKVLFDGKESSNYNVLTTSSTKDITVSKSSDVPTVTGISIKNNNSDKLDYSEELGKISAKLVATVSGNEAFDKLEAAQKLVTWEIADGFEEIAKIDDSSVGEVKALANQYGDVTVIARSVFDNTITAEYKLFVFDSKYISEYNSSGAIEGDLKVGSKVKAVLNTNEYVYGTPSVTYQWKKDGVNIDNEAGTKQEYTVSANDLGAVLSCVITGKSEDGYTGKVTATADTPVKMADMSYTVVFNDNLTKDGVKEQVITYNETPYEATLEKNTFVNPGFVISGWSTAPRGDVEYEDGGVLSLTDADDKGTITLYAIWEEDKTPVEPGDTEADKAAAAEAAQKYIDAAAALPQTKDAVTDTAAADSSIAAAKALAPTDAQKALLDDETKAKVEAAAAQIATAEKAVADKKAETTPEGGSGESGSGGDSATTGGSADVTPSSGGSGSSGGGGGSSNAKTVKNADGSTTTTTTTAKGTIETTTKTNADGSKTTSKVVKNKDGSGSVTETSISAAGTTKVVEVVTDTTGAATEVTTTVSNSKGASMKVTYAAKGTAITVSKVETTGKTAVSIPATVKVGGKTYKVTKIAASALKGNKEITKVTLGANVKAIGKNAFNGDSKLKTIVMKKAPTTVGKNAFKGIAKKATIKIKATKKAFKTAKKLIKKSGIASTVKIKRTK